MMHLNMLQLSASAGYEAPQNARAFAEETLLTAGAWLKVGMGLENFLLNGPRVQFMAQMLLWRPS